MKLFSDASRFIFFTGKGGVGKTSLSTATAIQLADAGKRVLLVSTDAASNLDEMLGVTLSNAPTPVPHVEGLSVLNIDPEEAARHYRQRVLSQMASDSTDEERETVREQLSGACTTEIASFDEFSSLLSDGAKSYDHVVFDTAPTGHTLRLLSLPKAWSGFLKDNDRGASCLGPHSGLKMQEARFNAAMTALRDPAQTMVVLVARPERVALAEAARASDELQALGLQKQMVAINGVFQSQPNMDAVARAWASTQQAALQAMPAILQGLPQTHVPLRPFDTVGLDALRALLADEPMVSENVRSSMAVAWQAPGLQSLVDDLDQAGKGLIMVMGKGGVGKTTVAAALALGLVRAGHAVHLSTTDPAAHLAATLEGQVDGLEVSRIDPHEETQRYIDKIIAARGAQLDEQEKALLLEDLQSPCTEEVAVFHAFSRIVSSARSAFVVLDTAPTGHSLLLMDATGAYHRQMTREFEGQSAMRVITPLMRLQDPDYTRIILVTLPEPTPVSQAAALQEDLRRASIEPYAWVVNKSLLATSTEDPVLRARAHGELQQMQRMAQGLARRTYAIPWMAQPPVGEEGLMTLLKS